MFNSIIKFFKEPDLAKEFWGIVSLVFMVIGGFALITNNLATLGYCAWGAFVAIFMMLFNRYLANQK